MGALWTTGPRLAMDATRDSRRRRPVVLLLTRIDGQMG